MFFSVNNYYFHILYYDMWVSYNFYLMKTDMLISLYLYIQHIIYE